MGSEVSRVQSNGENVKKHSSNGNDVSKKMSRRMSMGTAPIKIPDQQNTPSIRVGGSTGMLTVNDNGGKIIIKTLDSHRGRVRHKYPKLEN